ncbi:hypothetical protein ACLOJK_006854 [Asimina triloba]
MEPSEVDPPRYKESSGAGAMSAVLAFEFMPGGGFALSDGKSFDLAIPYQFIHVPASMARRTFNYVDSSPTAITLSAEGNWPTLLAATASSAPRPSPRAAILTPWPSRKAATAAAASSAPPPSRKAASTAAASSAP